MLLIKETEFKKYEESLDKMLTNKKLINIEDQVWIMADVVDQIGFDYFTIILDSRYFQDNLNINIKIND